MQQSAGVIGMAWLQRKVTERGRSLALMIGNHKRSDISITKLTAETREVGEAHITHNPKDNKTFGREGALL